MLRATTAYAFSTPQLQKVVLSWCALYILTWECASRHNGMHFFDISTSKSAPTLRRFVRFDFDKCFAPQRHTFSTSYPQKVLRDCQFFALLTSECALRHNEVHVFNISTSKIALTMCASGHNSVQFFISHLPKWLRTRRFSDPTFRPSGATKHWKNTVFRDFSTFSRTCIFFLLTLSLL